jgi:hypothetical protein
MCRVQIDDSLKLRGLISFDIEAYGQTAGAAARASRGDENLLALFFGDIGLRQHPNQLLLEGQVGGLIAEENPFGSGLAAVFSCGIVI